MFPAAGGSGSYDRPVSLVCIIPRSKNACLQGRFCEAVNDAAPRERQRGASPKACKARLSASIRPRSKNVCLHGHFCEAVNDAAPRERQRGASPKACKARLSASIIPYIKQKRQYLLLKKLHFWFHLIFVYTTIDIFIRQNGKNDGVQPPNQTRRGCCTRAFMHRQLPHPSKRTFTNNNRTHHFGSSAA